METSIIKKDFINIQEVWELDKLKYQKIAYLVMIMDFFHYIAYMCTKPQIVTLLKQVGASDAQQGFILSFFSIVQVFQALIISKLIQRFGQKGEMIVGAGFYALGAFALAGSNKFALALNAFLGIFGGGISEAAMPTVEIVVIGFGTLLFGISHGIFLLASQYVMTGIPKEHGREKLVGLYSFSNSAGKFVGPFIASAILGIAIIPDSLERRYVILAGAVASVVALIIALFITNIKRDNSTPPMNLKQMFTNGPVMKIIILNSAIYFAVDIVTNYAQSFGENVVGLAPEKAVLILSAVNLSEMIIRPVMGKLCEIFTSDRLFKIAMFVCAASIMLTGFTKEINGLFESLVHIDARFVFMLVFGLMIGMSLGLLNPLSMIKLSDVVSDADRSQALALRNMANYGGQTVGANMFGWVAQITGSLSPVYWISGLAMFGCFALSFDYKKKTKQ